MAEKQKDNKFKSSYYAHALFDLAVSAGLIDRTELELNQIKEEILNNIDFKKYLTDSSVPKTAKINSLIELFSGEACKCIEAFISMLIILDVVEEIDQIYNDYVLLVSSYKKQVLVEVISAIELDDKLLRQIKNEVDLKTGLDVRIKNILDSEVIGGIIIRIGEKIIDLSLKNKIQDLKNKLKSIEIRGEEFGIAN